MAVDKLPAVRKSLPAINKLRDGSKVEEYNLELTNRFACLSLEDVPLEGVWDTIKETVECVSMEV